MVDTSRIPQSETTPQSGPQIITKLDATLGLDFAAAVKDIATRVGSFTTVDGTTGWTIKDPGNEANGEELTLTMDRNTTLLPAGDQSRGKRIALKVIQDGTGSRVLTFSSIFKFPGGTPPVQSTAPGAIDFYEFYSHQDLSLYFIGGSIGAASV